MKRITWTLALIASVALPGQSAKAAFDLQITEMWPGNEPGSNLTDDWFEVSNLGDMAWTAAVDGDLYFDDDSFDHLVADLMSGVASIAPGESVVFVDGSATTGAANVALWLSIWGPDLGAAPQVGTYEGSGMSQGGDGAGLFLDTDFNGPQGVELIDAETYPDAELFGGQSYDVGLGVFSASVSNAITTTAVNDESQPAIGTPGFLGDAVVPEPGTAALAALGLICILSRRRS